MNDRIVGAIGFAAFVLVCVWTVAHSVPRIRTDLESRSAIALQSAGLPLDLVVFNGRDAVLTRSLAQPQHADSAGRVLQQVPGIRSIRVFSPDSTPSDR